MLADPIAAAFTASIVALAFFLCNVFENEIAAFFATPMLPPRLLRRVDVAVRLNPFGDLPFAPHSPIAPKPINGGGSGASPLPAPDWTDGVPHSPGLDKYHLYTGNGSIAAGWPHKSDWMSYEDMFTSNLPLLSHSCTIYHVSSNTQHETTSIHNATLIIALETNTDPRFILAIILQESGGCVRVPTSYYAVRNPGLMQSHNGPATCNEDATPVTPCPYATIEEMIREGTAGTSSDTGMGLVEALRQAEGGVDDVA
ncbi:MAG: hypothetical protein Q9225_006166, partial [Loekoesia sp. 1 TL-2023]